MRVRCDSPFGAGSLVHDRFKFFRREFSVLRIVDDAHHPAARAHRDALRPSADHLPHGLDALRHAVANGQREAMRAPFHDGLEREVVDIPVPSRHGDKGNAGVNVGPNYRPVMDSGGYLSSVTP